MSRALRRSFTSLAVPNYRRYFAGQLVSLSGNWTQVVAEMWLILALTGSGLAVGVTSALQFLPVLLFGAWGGLLADRMPKRSLLIVTQTLMALPALALWAVTTSGVVVPWMVFALVFARGTINAVDNPTRQSFAIEMVGITMRWKQHQLSDAEYSQRVDAFWSFTSPTAAQAPETPGAPPAPPAAG